MLGLATLILTSTIQQSSSQVGWSFNMDYECGIIISDTGVIERDITTYSKPLTFILISNEARLELESYHINAFGIKSSQILLSDSQRYSDSLPIDSWINKTLTLASTNTKLNIYAWIPSQYQMNSGINEIFATWSIDCT